MTLTTAGRPWLAGVAALAAFAIAPGRARALADEEQPAPEEKPAPKEVYQVRLVLDAPIIALGATAGLLRGTLASRFINRSCPCDPSGLNPLDRGTVGNHNATAATLSDISVGLSLGLPPLLGLLDLGWSKAWLEDVTVMTETVMVEILFQQAIGIGVGRPRPRTYDGEGYYLNGGEGYMSFYAGHVASAVAALTAASYTVRLRYGEQVWPWLVTGALGGSIALERVAAGQHFPTDTLAGFAVGFSVGLAVPWLHAHHPGAHLTVAPGPGDAGLALAGTF
jgi:membrane-associated phospholipid phosphatase